MNFGGMPFGGFNKPPSNDDTLYKELGVNRGANAFRYKKSVS